MPVLRRFRHNGGRIAARGVRQKRLRPTRNRRVRYGMTGLGAVIFVGAAIATLGISVS